MVLLSTMLSISTPGDNYFCDLFAALSILRVLDIQNLQLHMACSLISHINVSIEVCFIWHRWFVHCVGFLTMSSLSWRPKKLAFCAGFYSKSLHLPLCSVTWMIYLLSSQFKDNTTIYEQLGAWSFTDTFRTAEKRNFISLSSDDSLNASLLGHIRCFRISKIVTSLLSVCKVLYHSM